MANDGTDNAATPSDSQQNFASMGNRTLFVNTIETQKVPYVLGLPPLSPGYKEINIEQAGSDLGVATTATGDQDALVMTSFDWLRYNTGKFFYRREGTEQNYEFINSDSTSHPETITQELLGEDFFSPVVTTTIMQITPDMYSSLHTDLVFRDLSYVLVKLKEGVSGGPTNDLYLLGGTMNHASVYPPDASQQILDVKDWQGFIFSLDSNQGLNPCYDPAVIGTGFEGGVWHRLGSIQGLGVQAIDLVGDPNDKYPGSPLGGYNDHAFLFNSPAAAMSQDSVPDIRVLFADVKPTYNFFQKEYEEVVLEFEHALRQAANEPNTWIPDMALSLFELYLPNFNAILSEREKSLESTGLEAAQEFTSDINFYTHTTLNNRLPGNILRPLTIYEGDYPETSGPLGTSGNEYLKEWANTFKSHSSEILSDMTWAEAALKFRNIIFPLEAVKNENINTFKSSFPFYNEITFNTDINTKMADLLRDADLFLPLVSDYIYLTDPDSPSSAFNPGPVSLTSYEEVFAAGSAEALNSADAQDTNSSAFIQQSFPLNKDGIQYKQYLFDRAFASEVQGLNTESDLISRITSVQDRTISVGSESFSDDQIEFFGKNPLIQLIYKSMFLSQYINLIKNNKRTYEDIISGKTCYNETLFYKIEKRDALGNLIQNFYVLNDSQLDEATLIDTQIVYSKKYSYRIFAIQVVIGNEYRYGAPLTQPYDYPSLPYRWQSEVQAINDSSVRLIEVPYTSPKIVFTQELPPTPPDVNFIPFRHKDNRVMISLNSSADDYYDNFIPVLPHEVMYNTAILQFDPETGLFTATSPAKTHFKSEGDITSFTMFRISENDFPNGPKSYMDFGIGGVGKRVTLSMAQGAPSYIDHIQPNTKYWYLFRSNDEKHGLDAAATSSGIYGTSTNPDFSNPTNIFEIKATNNDGAIYFTMRTYDITFFDKQKQIASRIPTKSFRKYLMVKPNMEQSLINADPESGGFDFESDEAKGSIKEYIENLNDDVASIPLGVKQQNIFGSLPDSENQHNQFKVRLISRKTGRKLDIHLRFKKPVLEK